MDQIHYSIGQLGKETGCKVPTIRYYEKIGMLPEPRRSSGNQRIYGPEHLLPAGIHPALPRARVFAARDTRIVEADR